jgi:hypothetical protein
MDARAHELAKGSVNHALPFKAALAVKSRAFDFEAKVAFTFRIVAAVSAMLLALVDQFKAGGRKRRIEPREHLSGDWAGGSGVH